MKNLFKAMLSMAFLFIIYNGYAQNNEEDKKEIINVIQTGYVDGLLNYGDLEPTKKSFYPGFFISSFNNNQVSQYAIYNWMDRVEKKKAKGELPKSKLTAKFPLMDITEHAAIVKMELYNEEGMIVFTDYLSLYKFEEGWRIVQKIYYRHPEK